MIKRLACLLAISISITSMQRAAAQSPAEWKRGQCFPKAEIIALQKRPDVHIFGSLKAKLDSGVTYETLMHMPGQAWSFEGKSIRWGLDLMNELLNEARFREKMSELNISLDTGKVVRESLFRYLRYNGAYLFKEARINDTRTKTSISLLSDQMAPDGSVTEYCVL